MMETHEVAPESVGLSRPQYETLRALEEGALPLDIPSGGLEEELLLDLEALGLVERKTLLVDAGDESSGAIEAWAVSVRGRAMLRRVGVFKGADPREQVAEDMSHGLWVPPRAARDRTEKLLHRRLEVERRYNRLLLILGNVVAFSALALILLDIWLGR